MFFFPLCFRAQRVQIYKNKIVLDQNMRCIFFTFNVHQAGRIAPLSGPVLVREPYIFLFKS